MAKGIKNEMTASYTGAQCIRNSENNTIEYVKITGLEVKSGDLTMAKMPDGEGGEKVLLIRVLTGGEGA